MSKNCDSTIIKENETMNEIIDDKISNDNSDEYEYIYNYKYHVIGFAGVSVELDNVKKVLKKKTNTIKKN